MDFRSRWVFVTGASSGLGLEMARVLARDHGANLILVARRRDRLEKLREELNSAHGVEVDVIVADLSKAEDVDRAFREATARHPIYGVVLNAGVTHFGEYDELSWDDFRAMLETNVVSVVRLSTLFLPYLEQKNQGGGLMLVSSMAGLVPVPYQTAYSGTKAFIINYGCGLWHETHDKNVSVTTFVPGGIQTEMTSTDRFKALGGWLMPADRCASAAIQAFRQRRYLHVPGFVYRAGTVAMKLLPQQLLTGRVAATYRKALESSRSGV